MEGAATVIGTCRDEVREDVVCVRSHDELVDGKAKPFGVVASQDVAEVACGHAEVNLVTDRDGVCAYQLRVGIEVVGDLRHKTSDVDGIRA